MPSSYQPNIPTGTVNLDEDYQNIQGNFQQLDTSFGIDHVTYSNQTAQNGYHTSIHLNPVSTTTTNPPNNQPPVQPVATTGYGQLFSAQINDGVNTDEALYFLTGGDRLLQLTRNFVPVLDDTGYTFLPGGIIMQWGRQGLPTVSSSGIVTFPIPFPNACLSVQTQAGVDIADVPNGQMTVGVDVLQTTDFFWKTVVTTTKYRRFLWTAIGF